MALFKQTINFKNVCGWYKTSKETYCHSNGGQEPHKGFKENKRTYTDTNFKRTQIQTSKETLSVKRRHEELVDQTPEKTYVVNGNHVHAVNLPSS